MLNYLSDVKKEVSKVVWPEKPETARKTAIVLVVATAVALSFAVLDMGVLEGLKLLVL